MGLLEVIAEPILIMMVIEICTSGYQHVKPVFLSARDEENAYELIRVYNIILCVFYTYIIL